MNSDALLIVLTENHWLYAGLAALLPGMVSLRMRFGARRLVWEVRNFGRVLIVVDSRIVFSGEWSALNALQARRPDATVVWLAGEDTGRVFPVENRGDRILSQGQGVASLRSALKRARQWSEFRHDEERVVPVNLTRTERYLLPYFASGMRVPELSRLTGKPMKTLYTHRQKILVKTGFRQAAFLQFVYERNRGLPGVPGLERVINF